MLCIRGYLIVGKNKLYHSVLLLNKSAYIITVFITLHHIILACNGRIMNSNELKLIFKTNFRFPQIKILKIYWWNKLFINVAMAISIHNKDIFLSTKAKYLYQQRALSFFCVLNISYFTFDLLNLNFRSKNLIDLKLVVTWNCRIFTTWMEWNPVIALVRTQFWNFSCQVFVLQDVNLSCN